MPEIQSQTTDPDHQSYTSYISTPEGENPAFVTFQVKFMRHEHVTEGSVLGRGVDADGNSFCSVKFTDEAGIASVKPVYDSEIIAAQDERDKQETASHGAARPASIERAPARVDEDGFTLVESSGNATPTVAVIRQEGQPSEHVETGWRIVGYRQGTDGMEYKAVKGDLEKIVTQASLDRARAAAEEEKKSGPQTYAVRVGGTATAAAGVYAEPPFGRLISGPERSALAAADEIKRRNQEMWGTKPGQSTPGKPKGRGLLGRLRKGYIK